jgi:DNA topoisomerase-1
VGVHPETGKPITAGIGRYGPFVLHDGTYANLESVDEVFAVGLNRAVSALADKKAGKGGRFGRAAPRQVLKDLGEHPSEGGKIEVLNGRYGPYVTHNKVNANIPRGKDPATLTVDEAVGLLSERAAKGPPAKGRGFKRGAKAKEAEPKAAKAKAEKPAKTAAEKKSVKPAAKAKPKAKPAKTREAAE